MDSGRIWRVAGGLRSRNLCLLLFARGRVFTAVDSGAVSAIEIRGFGRGRTPRAFTPRAPLSSFISVILARRAPACARHHDRAYGAARHSRRAVSALALLSSRRTSCIAAPPDVLQSTSGRGEYASGFTFKPISQIKDEVKSMLSSWDAAYAWTRKLAGFTRGSRSARRFAGKPAAVHGSAAAADRFAKSGGKHREQDRLRRRGREIAHVGHQLSTTALLARADHGVHTADGWKIDEQVLPLGLRAPTPRIGSGSATVLPLRGDGS